MTRILVVENEGAIAEHLQRTLRRLGYEVPEPATTGEAALDAAEEGRPGLVLMDIHLAGELDGIDTAVRLREHADVPVVFLSAHTDEASLARARAAQPYGYLLKPFDERELRTTIEVALYKHRVERELRDRERWLDTTLRSIGDGVIATDEGGRVVMMNLIAERLTGWLASEARGRDVSTVFRLVGGRAGEPREVPTRRAMREGAAASSAEGSELVARGGERRPVEGSASPILDERGRLLGAVLVFRDVGERCELERRLLEASRLASLGTLSAGIAHEINNPLAYVLMNLQFLREGFDGLRAGTLTPSDPGFAELEDALAGAVDGGRRVQGIVRALRTFAGGGEGGEARATVNDLGDVVQNAIRLASTEVRHKARVTTHFGDVLMVRAPVERLCQVFINLLVNAAQAMPRGRGSGANVIAVRTYGDERGRAVAEVCDNGRGIAPEHLSRVFDPFFTTKQAGEGTGLGLAICRAIFSACEGTLEVQSEPGEGSVFRVTLPAASPSGAATPPEPSVRPEPTRSRRVLVVDDEVALCAALKRALGGRHEVTTASSAARALELLRSGQRFDAIVCDLLMPDPDGIAFYETLEREHPQQAKRVIFATGGAVTTRAQAFLAVTPRPRVTKPFDLRRLAGLIDEVSRSE